MSEQNGNRKTNAGRCPDDASPADGAASVPRPYRFQSADSPSQLNAEDTAGLSSRGVALVTHSADNIIQQPGLHPAFRSLVLLNFVYRLRAHGTAFINDIPTMTRVLPTFLEHTRREVARRTFRPVNGFSRTMFRLWTGLYFLRSEPAAAGQFRRAAYVARIATGRGDPGSLPFGHPSGAISRGLAMPSRSAKPFPCPQTVDDSSSDEVFRPYETFASEKLRNLQYFGPAYYGADLFDGLRALAQSYAVVLGLARFRACSRQSPHIERADINYAVNELEAKYGNISKGRWRWLYACEKYFNDWRYGCLLRSLEWG